jgi:hypothetical protein
MTLPSSCSLTVSDAVVHAAYNSDEDARKVFDFLGSQPAALPLPGPSAVAVTALIDEAWKAGSSWEVGNPQSEERAALFDKLASALSTLAPSAASDPEETTSPYEWLAQEFDRLAILRKMWTALEVAAMIRRHDIYHTSALASPSAEAAQPVALTRYSWDKDSDGYIEMKPFPTGAFVRYDDAMAALSQPQGELREALLESRKQLNAIIEDGTPTDFRAWRDDIDAALAGRTAG